MEFRKIQKTGGSSYIVSLPKPWADEHGLREKMKVGIITRNDGTLVVIPKISSEINQKHKTINVDNIGENESLLFRLLVASYFQGYGIIKVKSENRLEPDVRELVKNFKNDGIGLEIMEETPNSLTIKDLLNPAEVKFKQWLERISQLVVTQIREALLSIQKRDVDIANEVITRDREVNRINWLMSRQHKIVTTNVFLTDRFEMNKEYVADYSWMSRIIERVGDHAVKIAQYNKTMMEEELDKSIVETVVSVGKTAINLFQASIDTFFDNNITEANENIERVIPFLDHCKEIENIAYTQEGVVALSLAYVSESIRRIGEYSADLAEYVINFLIEEPKDKQS
ncbi:AbrB/MazE/SpoVT family DNA-binding domain-containing protein [Candidatus Bathyarchaeota archaeon]|nr:AbrB/MazE/SpoVT family DNA-binding domain-containing protein [Candidatus Bathyarchaeota archaeon]